MGTIPPTTRGEPIDDGEWSWDPNADIPVIVVKLGWRGVADAHAWYEGYSHPPMLPEMYMFPHHKLRGDELVLSREGVHQAMRQLNQTAGQEPPPAVDREKIYEHLRVHFEELGEEPPKLKE